MEFVLDGRRVYAGTGGRVGDPAAPVVVLLHGAGMDHTIFAAQARALAHRGRSVLAFDLPGHGRSEGPALASIAALAEWVLAAASACGAERFRLAGHSMGALVALEAAARGGARVEALALIGFAPEMRVHPDLLAAARAGAPMAVELMTGWSFAAAGQLGGARMPGVFLPGSALRLLERADKESLAADLAACDAYRGAADSAGRIRCPVLLLLGGADRMTPAAQARSFAPRFADARVSVLPAAGHLPMIEEPGPCLAALQEVL
ncbi:MAG TPA: alpha/beta hydrolase [Stellaceae bacterium]|nr:alpha/beta hydrolase [Stellaceae bacterium]